jgi:hypothetical protein
MPASYPKEAVELCESLYLRFNGQQHDRIQAEMQKAGYGSWSKQNLYTRGKGPNQKIGWIEKYGWEKALTRKLELASERKAVSADEQLVRDIEEVQRRVRDQLKLTQPGSDRDLLYQFRDLSKLLIEARTKLEARRDTFGGFVQFWERLLDWLPEIDAPAARALLAVADSVLERAGSEYGETETAAADDGTKSRPGA